MFILINKKEWKQMHSRSKKQQENKPKKEEIIR